MEANMPSALLLLPQELRDLIYQSLLLPHHVYTSSATLDTYTIHRTNKVQPTYIDTRIYLPARFPGNILQTCKQLREECLSFYAHHLNSLQPTPATHTTPAESETSHQLAARNNTALDETMERHHDEGIVRITVEILRAFRGTMGMFVPVRDVPSPHFLALLPLLSRVKRLKLIVWAGYDWWSGNSTRPIVDINRFRSRVKSKRTWLDQTGVVPAAPTTVAKEEDDHTSDVVVVQPRRPDHLATAIKTLLHHLPSLQDLHIDVLLHVLDFTNWDLPEEIKWEGIRGWLDGPVCPSADERQLRKVQRRLVVVHPVPPTLSGTFLRQCEVRREGENVVHVERGVHALTDEDWEEGGALEDPPYTEHFVRSV